MSDGIRWGLTTFSLGLACGVLGVATFSGRHL